MLHPLAVFHFVFAYHSEQSKKKKIILQFGVAALSQSSFEICQQIQMKCIISFYLQTLFFSLVTLLCVIFFFCWLAVRIFMPWIYAILINIKLHTQYRPHILMAFFFALFYFWCCHNVIAFLVQFFIRFIANECSVRVYLTVCALVSNTSIVIAVLSIFIGVVVSSRQHSSAVARALCVIFAQNTSDKSQIHTEKWSKQRHCVRVYAQRNVTTTYPSGYDFLLKMNSC